MMELNETIITRKNLDAFSVLYDMIDDKVFDICDIFFGTMPIDWYYERNIDKIILTTTNESGEDIDYAIPAYYLWLKWNQLAEKAEEYIESKKETKKRSYKKWRDYLDSEDYSQYRKYRAIYDAEYGQSHMPIDPA